MTQNEMVLDHLRKYHKITDLDAYSNLGVRRLSAIIWRLRNAGIMIRTENTTRPNRFGIPTTFATYVLEE